MNKDVGIFKAYRGKFTYMDFKNLIKAMCDCRSQYGILAFLNYGFCEVLGITEETPGVLELKKGYEDVDSNLLFDLAIAKEEIKSIKADLLNKDAPITYVYKDGSEVVVENGLKLPDKVMWCPIYSSYHLLQVNELSMVDDLYMAGLLYSPLFKDCRGTDYWLKVAEKLWVLSGREPVDDSYVDMVQECADDVIEFCH